MDTLTFARRRFLLVAAGAAMAGLTGCGSPRGATTPVGTVSVTSGMEPVVLGEPASSSGPVTARAALTRFGVAFLRAAMELAPAPATAISPYSLFTVLAMARAGAAGATGEQIDAALGAAGEAQGPLVSAVDAGMAAALDAATAVGASLSLRAANQTWADEGLRVHQSYLDRLAREFGSTARLADFAGDPEGTRGAINAWVAERTNDLIPDLFPEGSIDPSTRMVLVNALYLKAAWERPFSPRVDGTFTTSDGRQPTVPMMRGIEPVSGVRGNGWTAVTLPYAGEGLGMTVLLPDGDVVGFLDDLPAAVETVASATNQAAFNVSLPVFSLHSAPDAQIIAEKLGIVDLFGAADLSGISDEDLAAAAFVHQCVVSVDEEGTEAAAATGMMLEESATLASDSLVVDRPFVFWIADTTTGAPLFLGVVLDPSPA